MVKAAPAASFIVPEPDLLLELLIVALDAPAQLGEVDQIAERDIWRNRREPIFGRLLLSFRPLDQQPLFSAFSAPLMPVSNVNAKACKPRRQPVVRAFPPLDRLPSFRRQPERDLPDRD